MSFARRIQANGASIIRPISQEGPPWIKHSDPRLRAWMDANGYASIEDIPPEADYRPPELCERCGDRGVEVHHTAPREWFGSDECERWPTQNLCRSCHRKWHWAAERAAAMVTVRILRGRGLHLTADTIERALEKDRESFEASVATSGTKVGSR